MKYSYLLSEGIYSFGLSLVCLTVRRSETDGWVKSIIEELRISKKGHFSVSACDTAGGHNTFYSCLFLDLIIPDVIRVLSVGLGGANERVGWEPRQSRRIIKRSRRAVFSPLTHNVSHTFTLEKQRWMVGYVWLTGRRDHTF